MVVVDDDGSGRGPALAVQYELDGHGAPSAPSARDRGFPPASYPRRDWDDVANDPMTLDEQAEFERKREREDAKAR